MKTLRIGVIALSSVVPKIELELGVAKLKSEGYDVRVHPSVYGEHWFYAGTDTERAEALLEFAFDSTIDVIWCARGGYGATQLLPLIEKATKRRKPKKKLFIGYSDATTFLEFTRVHFGWKTFHAPMPALKTFSDLKDSEWSTLIALLRDYAGEKTKTKQAIYTYPLTPVFRPKNFKPIEAFVTGGNLSVWNSMIGTHYEGKARGKILFLEDLQENIGRLNRMLHHLEQSGGLKGVKAIVLGDFLDCRDMAPQVFKRVPRNLHQPTPDELTPVRKVHDPIDSLYFIFRELGERTGIAVFAGVPVGHGENQFSLSFSDKHSISAKGEALCLKK